MKIQSTIRVMHTDVPITGVSVQGKHTHQCNLCENTQIPCDDIFYVRRRELSDTIICRVCAEIPAIQDLFHELPHLLEMGKSNIKQAYNLALASTA